MTLEEVGDDEILLRYVVRDRERRMKEIAKEIERLTQEAETATKRAERVAAQLERHNHLFEDSN